MRDLHDILARTVACPETGCWFWEGSTTGEENGRRGRGRPKIHWGKQWRITTRVVVELITGKPLPKDKQVDHLCRRKLCIRPEHLEPVSQSVNMKRRYE